MKFRGADFIQNVQTKQEESEEQQRLSELQYAANNRYDDLEYNDYYDNSNLQNGELEDIALIKDAPKKPNDKKKYVVLALFLTIVFIFTVIVIRFFMNYSTQNDLLNQEQNKSANETAIEKNFEKVVNKTKDINASDINKTHSESNTSVALITPTPPPTVTSVAKTATIPATVTVTPTKATEAKPIKTDAKNEKIDKVIADVKKEATPHKRDIKEIFGIKDEVKQSAPKETKQEQIKPKEQKSERKIEQKVVEKPKQVEQKTIKKQDKKVEEKQKVTAIQVAITDTTAQKFIQVGSFSKAPAQELFDKIKTLGYTYKINKIEANGVTIEKVIIGPLDEKNAQVQLQKVKEKINPSAFIVK